MNKTKKIKILVLDVDGTLTDGKINISNEGELFKSFDVKDGHGLNLIMKKGIKVAIITARKSEIVKKRAYELNIKDVLQNRPNKLKAFEDLMKKYNFDYDEMAYMGDDLLDIPVMEQAGFSAVPNDAVEKAQKKADFVSRYKGGNGAVRDVCDFLLKN